MKSEKSILYYQEAFRKADLANLISGGAPSDEYDLLAEDAYKKSFQVKNRREMREEILRLIEKNFGSTLGINQRKIRVLANKLFPKEMNENLRPVKIVAYGVSLVLFLALFLLVRHYIPFFQEKFAFSLSYEGGETIVENENFNLRFKLESHCILEGDMQRRLMLEEELFSGYFVCDDYTQYVSVQRAGKYSSLVTDTVTHEGRVTTIERYNGEYRIIKIDDNFGKNSVIFSAAKNWNHGRGLEILDEIRDSIELQ
ncbi:MAG: hypothetical protein AAB448_03070 [Patescibacteria group bacterium]